MISITVFKEQVSYSKLYYFYSVEYTPLIYPNGYTQESLTYYGDREREREREIKKETKKKTNKQRKKERKKERKKKREKENEK